MLIEDYAIEEHIHRFGLWTAARAASTSRFSNSEVATFITNCRLKESVENLRGLQDMNHQVYKQWFVEMANSLTGCMKHYEKEVKRKKKFGIAAKIISIYIKTVEVVPSGGRSRISQVAFPPIDRFLLTGLKEKLPIKNLSWSEVEEDEFMKLIKQLKDFMQEKPFWKLEFYWDLNRE